ncbi:hypothetical protein SNEBB_011433 [Seison nebaliae]|nr:hypothetical protein SNEBB_011433 [Seison nebaliae]
MPTSSQANILRTLNIEIPRNSAIQRVFEPDHTRWNEIDILNEDSSDYSEIFPNDENENNNRKKNSPYFMWNNNKNEENVSKQDICKNTEKFLLESNIKNFFKKKTDMITSSNHKFFPVDTRESRLINRNNSSERNKRLLFFHNLPLPHSNKNSKNNNNNNNCNDKHNDAYDKKYKTEIKFHESETSDDDLTEYNTTSSSHLTTSNQPQLSHESVFINLEDTKNLYPISKVSLSSLNENWNGKMYESSKSDMKLQNDKFDSSFNCQQIDLYSRQSHSLERPLNKKNDHPPLPQEYTSNIVKNFITFQKYQTHPNKCRLRRKTRPCTSKTEKLSLNDPFEIDEIQEFENRFQLLQQTQQSLKSTLLNKSKKSKCNKLLETVKESDPLPPTQKQFFLTHFPNDREENNEKFNFYEKKKEKNYHQTEDDYSCFDSTIFPVPNCSLIDEKNDEIPVDNSSSSQLLPIKRVNSPLDFHHSQMDIEIEDGNLSNNNSLSESEKAKRLIKLGSIRPTKLLMERLEHLQKLGDQVDLGETTRTTLSNIIQLHQQKKLNLINQKNTTNSLLQHSPKLSNGTLNCLSKTDKEFIDECYSLGIISPKKISRNKFVNKFSKSNKYQRQIRQKLENVQQLKCREEIRDMIVEDKLDIKELIMLSQMGITNKLIDENHVIIQQLRKLHDELTNNANVVHHRREKILIITEYLLTLYHICGVDFRQIITNLKSFVDKQQKLKQKLQQKNQHENLRQKIETLKQLWFQGPPERKPNTILIESPGMKFSHIHVAQAIRDHLKQLPHLVSARKMIENDEKANENHLDEKGNIRFFAVKIEFMPRCIVLDSDWFFNRWIITMNCFEARQEMLTNGHLMINDESFECKPYDEVIQLEYISYLKCKEHHETIEQKKNNEMKAIEFDRKITRRTCRKSRLSTPRATYPTVTTNSIALPNKSLMKIPQTAKTNKTLSPKIIQLNETKRSGKTFHRNGRVKTSMENRKLPSLRKNGNSNSNSPKTARNKVK